MSRPAPVTARSSSPAPGTAPAPDSRWSISDALALGALALIIALLHGRCVNDGLFMDDYAHLQQLRAADWSLHGLADACRLELVGGVIELWWLPDCTLRFFRPLAFAVMKAVYELSGWSPVAAHIASLCWHLLACVLLYRLLLRFGNARSVAWFVAALFAIHPAHTATVQWIASQTELMVTCAALGLMLVWTGRATQPVSAAGLGLGRSRLAAGAALYLAALGCRENAIVLPAVLFVADWAGRRVRPIPWRGYAVLAAIAVGYLVLRSAMLGGAAVPPKPYVMPPGDPDFVRYVFDKTCYYFLGEFWLVPAVPIGGLAFLREWPVVFYGLSGVTLAGLAGLIWVSRRSGGSAGGAAVGVGLAWLLLTMAPVLPVFESPHHLYLPGIGWALLMGRGLALLAAPEHPWIVRAGTKLAAVAGSVAFAGVTYFNGMALEAALEVEDRVVADIIETAPDLRDGDTLYLANPPIIAHYTRLAVEEATGRRDLRVVALSWAPRVLGVQSNTECRRIDDRTIELHVAEQHYFEGPFGRLVQAATGRTAAEALAQGVQREGYRVELIAGDAAGISALRVTFERPWGREGTHLFWGSMAGFARRLPPE